LIAQISNLSDDLVDGLALILMGECPPAGSFAKAALLDWSLVHLGKWEQLLGTLHVKAAQKIIRKALTSLQDNRFLGLAHLLKALRDAVVAAMQHVIAADYSITTLADAISDAVLLSEKAMAVLQLLQHSPRQLAGSQPFAGTAGPGPQHASQQAPAQAAARSSRPQAALLHLPHQQQYTCFCHTAPW
jgi:hypothetical protein